jgi:signal transduction histidine kinase
MALAVALPLCALLAVTVAGLAGRHGVVATETRVGHLYSPAASLADTIVALHDEARLSNWVLASADAPTNRLTAARALTDGAIIGLRLQLLHLRKAHADVAVARMGQLFDQLDLLGEQRKFIDLRLLPIDSATGYYKDTVGGVLRVLDTLNSGIHDATEVANLRDFTTVARFVAAAGEEHSVLAAGFAQRALSAGQTNDLFGAIASQDAYQALFLSQATPPLRVAFEQQYQPGSNVVNRVHAMRSVALAGHVNTGIVSGADWYDATTAQRASLRDGTHNVLRAVERSGLARKHSAEHAMVLYGFGAGAALLAALALAYAIVRSTTTPLRRLTAAARDVSERQLPRLLHALHADPQETDFAEIHPIEMSSRDEVGELAHAFNSIETATVDVAREHAALLRQGISDLYVNLARRNQSLLERQLRVIDQLESRESDPETLGALFTVDQFATRMRRNAESLLILAGVDQPRPTTSSVRIFDVVRAAASEIDEYARVELTEVDETTELTGRVMVDLTHLLAELLENATAFSPPETRVVVRGRSVDSGYELSVVDLGLGMSSDALAAANLLLRQPPPPRLALSRSLGHLVVARLAARAGVHVELRDGSPGVVAVVSIPATLLVERDEHDERAGAASEKTPLPRRVARAAKAPAPADAAAVSNGTAPAEGIPAGEERVPHPEPVTVDLTVSEGVDADVTPRPPGWTTSGLPKRMRKTMVQALRARVTAGSRSPDEVFEVVARYESGRRRGLRDAVSGTAGVTGDEEPRDGAGEPGSAATNGVEGRVQPGALPRRTPGRTAVPERAEPEPPADPRPPDQAFELVARYEWGRRRAQLTGNTGNTDADGLAQVEDE